MTEYSEYRVDIEGFFFLKEESAEVAEEEAKMYLPQGFHLRVTKVSKYEKPTKIKII